MGSGELRVKVFHLFYVELMEFVIIMNCRCWVTANILRVGIQLYENLSRAKNNYRWD